ncbi:MAG: Na/Pi cotransporter family protein [Lachnospiraceae bacterium]|nr:Na/Pi cotransporter family protein [Lachnospiraceae bacterium]
MQYVYDVFLLLGGIALFLYGISFMSRSLEDAAGSKLRVILEKMTSNGFLSLLVGIFVTALIQSSGATGVMVVGFVSAQMMSLVQSMFVMLGANIGTTITAQIIAFKITSIAPLILFVGMIMYMFVKHKMTQKIGGVVLGFGLLFVGIFLMGEATDKLNLSVLVESFLKNFSNPLLLILFGTVFTAIIQSSSASVGILQVLFGATVASSVSLEAIFYVILGMNIGASSPIVFASLSGDRTSKRTGLANLVLKMVGALFFALITLIFPGFLRLVADITPNDTARQIANLHLVFNVLSSLVLCPFVPFLGKLLMKLVPDAEEDDEFAKKFLYITPEVVLTPSLAVVQTKREITRMSKLAVNNLALAIDMFFGRKKLDFEYVEQVEKTINYLNHELNGYLVELHSTHLDEKELVEVGMMFKVIADVERIGDHAENIAEYAKIADDYEIQFSEDATSELEEMAETSVRVCTLASEVYADNLFEKLQEVTNLEEKVDEYQDKLTENHILRLKNDLCNPRGGVMFTDMVTDLERCADHAINIAYAINGEKTVEVKKAYIVTRGNNAG